MTEPQAKRIKIEPTNAVPIAESHPPKASSGQRTLPDGTILESHFIKEGTEFLFRAKSLNEKVTHSNGIIIEGYFHKDGNIVRLLKGKKTSPDGQIEEGDFHNNGRIIKGKVTYPNRMISEGGFHKDGYLLKGKRKKINLENNFR